MRSVRYLSAVTACLLLVASANATIGGQCGGASGAPTVSATGSCTMNTASATTIGAPQKLSAGNGGNGNQSAAQKSGSTQLKVAGNLQHTEQVALTSHRHKAVKGVCGPASGVGSSTAPSSGLCSSGTASAVSGGNGSAWTWTCFGLNGGSNASCSAPYIAPIINGACGPANGVPTNTAPSSGLCSAGTATAVTGSGPWAWNCQGANGGTTASCSAPVRTGSTGGQVPGPSQALFNTPYYSCVSNYYVSNSGSDSNDGKTTPWKTLQHADSANVGPGSCVNVAPGTYDGINVIHGGNAATATGYVVYRCQSMDGCTINGNAGHNGNGAVDFDFSNVSATAPNTVNYVQFDGFVLVGQSLASQGPYGVGFDVFNGDNSNKVASHHICY
jgi:hypothetical protein